MSLREAPTVIPACFRFRVEARVSPGFWRIDFIGSVDLASACFGSVEDVSSTGAVDEASAATGMSEADVVAVLSASGVPSAMLTDDLALDFLPLPMGAGLEPAGGDFNKAAFTDALLPAFFPVLDLAFPTGRNPIFFFLVTFLEDTKVVIGSDIWVLTFPLLNLLSNFVWSSKIQHSNESCSNESITQMSLSLPYRWMSYCLLIRHDF